MIGKTSRYARTPRRTTRDVSGSEVTVLELRPAPPTAAVLRVAPKEGERLDHLAARYYRDPRKFWKICDASDHLDPFDVVGPGRPVAIPPDK